MRKIACFMLSLKIEKLHSVVDIQVYVNITMHLLVTINTVVSSINTDY